MLVQAPAVDGGEHPMPSSDAHPKVRTFDDLEDQAPSPTNL
jgi:hypothetical protein